MANLNIQSGHQYTPIVEGTVTAPGLAFRSNNDTGFWSPSAAVIALSTAGVERLRVDDSGVITVGGTTAPVMTVTPVASGVNYVDVTSAVTTAGPAITVKGTDTNIDLNILPKGTAYVKLNTASFVANGTVAMSAAGSLGPTGATGTVGKWLVVKDQSGQKWIVGAYAMS